MIKITNSPDLDRWSEFVYNHPHGNIFQSPEMAEVYKRTKNYEPISLAAIDCNTKEILGVLQGVVIKEISGFLSSFSARSIVHGSPLLVEGMEGIKALRILMQHYDKLMQNRVLYTQIRNLWNTSGISNTLGELGYKYDEHLNFLINLNKSKEELWNQLKKDKKRGIKKAKKKGIVVDELREGDGELIPVFYRILKEAYNNAKIPFADISLFRSAFELLAPKNMAKFYIAKYGGKIIAVRVILSYKGIMYDWYASALRDYLSFYVNEALVWHILKEGANNGYHIFDFGGAGKPSEEYGVREFKRRFGGKLVNFGRYTKAYSPVKTKIAEKGFKMYRRLFI